MKIDKYHCFMIIAVAIYVSWQTCKEDFVFEFYFVLIGY